MESDIQRIQEDERITKHPSRYPENTSVWQQINIKNPRKKRGKIGIRKFIQHLIVGLMSGKDSKKALEVFKKLEWYITLIDKFPDVSCSRCRVVEGYDVKRGRSYRVVVVDGIEDENLGMEVEVGKVVERWGDEEEEYYILSTQTGVEPEELREMAIERWSIEISFRELNQIMNTKRLRSHNLISSFNFAILQIIAMNLLLSFLLYLEPCKRMSYVQSKLPLSTKARCVLRG